MSMGTLFIISGPSGSGKGTVVKSLAASCGDFALSVSVTTRKMREGELEGVHYFYKSVPEFERMRDNNELLEHASFVGNLYGTPRFYVEEKIREGKIVLLEIEVNGALQVRNKYPDCVLIFLVPPSFTELKRRLEGRGTEDEVTARARMVRAREELSLIDKYDYLVINDKINNAVESIRQIAFTEKLRPSRNTGMTEGFFGENGNKGII